MRWVSIFIFSSFSKLLIWLLEILTLMRVSIFFSKQNSILNEKTEMIKCETLWIIHLPNSPMN